MSVALPVNTHQYLIEVIRGGSSIDHPHGDDAIDDLVLGTCPDLGDSGRCHLLYFLHFVL